MQIQDNPEEWRYEIIAAYVRRHPDEYLDLVAPGMRERVMEGVGDE